MSQDAQNARLASQGAQLFVHDDVPPLKLNRNARPLFCVNLCPKQGFYMNGTKIPALYLWMHLMLLPLALLAQTSGDKPLEHIVHKSETVYGIAQRYGTSVEQIYRLNPWAKDRAIKEGDKLILPKNQITALGAMQPHRVAAGETIYRICQTYKISEAELYRANPGITPQYFPVGYELRIPSKTSATERPQSVDSITHAYVEEEPAKDRGPVKVLLMLPFKQMPQYVEFYEGFLMGMNDLKKDGVSITLTAVDISEAGSLDEQISTGILYGQDLVIGGTTDEQIQAIGQKMTTGLYVIPFNAQEYDTLGSAQFVRLNQQPRDVAQRAVSQFVERYSSHQVYFVGRNQDTEEAFAQYLKEHLKRSHTTYRYLNLDKQGLEHLPAEAVIVPISSSLELGNLLLSELNRHSKSCTIFGYPQWQSYGSEFLTQARRYNTTIYSSFFFDPESTEGKQFLTKYRAWFSKKTGNSFPKFSVLGYDVSRYFIRSYASLGMEFMEHSHLLSSDGLQLDIELHPSGGGGRGFSNIKFYFVTFASDGTTKRLSL